jgi:hypothetical protein
LNLALTSSSTFLAAGSFWADTLSSNPNKAVPIKDNFRIRIIFDYDNAGLKPASQK